MKKPITYDTKSKGVTPGKCKRRPGCPDPSPPKPFNITKPYGKTGK